MRKGKESERGREGEKKGGGRILLSKL